jgi:hypothetical protein
MACAPNPISDVFVPSPFNPKFDARMACPPNPISDIVVPSPFNPKLDARMNRVPDPSGLAASQTPSVWRQALMRYRRKKLWQGVTESSNRKKTSLAAIFIISNMQLPRCGAAGLVFQLHEVTSQSLF